MTVKRPSRSVTEPVWVPLTTTPAPTIGMPCWSTTVPETLAGETSCAPAPKAIGRTSSRASPIFANLRRSPGTFK